MVPFIYAIKQKTCVITVPPEELAILPYIVLQYLGKSTTVLNQTAGYDFEMGIVLLQCHVYWIEVYSVCPLTTQLHTEKKKFSLTSGLLVDCTSLKTCGHKQAQ